MPPSAASKGATTRAAILDRAVDLASTDGLEGLTIGRLAAELQMSKSGLFAHFGSKEELQLAAVDQATQRFVAQVVAPAQTATEGGERLLAYVDGYLGSLEQTVFPGGCFWAAATAEFDDRPGPVREAILAALQAWLGELERQAGLAGVEHPADLAFEIYSLGLGANAYSRLFGDRDAFKRARAAVQRLLEPVVEAE